MDQVLLDGGGGRTVVLARIRDARGCWLCLRQAPNSGPHQRSHRTDPLRSGQVHKTTGPPPALIRGIDPCAPQGGAQEAGPQHAQLNLA